MLASSSASAQHARDAVEWRDEWTPVRPVEAIGTVGLTLLSLFLVPKLDGPHRRDFRGGIGFLDNGARSLLRARSPRVQEVTAEYSDLGFRALALFPYVVDVGIVTLGVHRDPELALQLALIDAEALTLAGFTQLITSRVLVARGRPYLEDCENGRSGYQSCGKNSADYRAFFSGHAAGTFTSAALTCLHHEHIPLYGGGAVETWACAWALSVASAVSVFRLTSDNHYVTDVLAGAAVGGFYGYLMPKWLHYDLAPKNHPAFSRLFLHAAPIERGAALRLVGTM